MIGSLYWNGGVSIGGRRCGGSQEDWNAMILPVNGRYSSGRDDGGGSQSSTMQCDVSYGSEAEYIAEMVKQSFHRCVGVGSV